MSAVLRIAALVAAMLCLTACDRRPPIEIVVPPVEQLQRTFWKLPDFTLTERTGNTVTLADLAGKVWVADFFYSTCPGPCPMLSSRFSELQKRFGDDDRVRLVSISTDPEKDTPEVLQGYAGRFHAGARWLFLTGSKSVIHELARDGFKLPFAVDATAAEPITHSTRLILVDQSGNIRGLYEGVGGDGVDRLAGDIQRLVETER